MALKIKQAFQNMVAFREDPLGLFAQKSAGGDGLAFFELGVRHAAIVTSPELAKAVLTHPDFAKDAKPIGFAGSMRGFSILKDFIGSGLPVLDGEEALARRKWVMPAYNSAQRGWVTRPPTNGDVRMRELLAQYPAHDIDLSRVIGRLIFEQYCAVMFGRPYEEFSFEITRAIESANRVSHTLSTSLLPWPHRWGGLNANVFQTARATLYGFAAQVVDDLFQSLDKAGPLPVGFMALPLGEVSPQVLLDEVVTQLAAGTESTTLAASWNALLLAQHPLWWNRVREQVQSTPVEQLSRLALSGDTALSQCIREGLRLYPAFWQFLRVAQTDTVLVGRPISKGTICFISPYLAQRDAIRIPDPDAYLPERKDAGAIGEMLTFGYGPRSCVGGRMAVSLIMSVIGSLVRRAPLIPKESHRTVQAHFFGLKRVGGFRFESAEPTR